MNESSRHILIVDNDARIVEEIVRGLRDQTTFQIHAFTNSADARAALQQTSFGLIIADWKMADVDGVTLIREAKARSPRNDHRLDERVRNGGDQIPAHRFHRASLSHQTVHDG